MKVYIRKISAIFLMLSIILATMNIGSYVSYAEENSDFSYYYVGAESDVKTCSADEINDVIANATGDMIIEMNKDVTLPATMVFGSAAKYTLELNDNSLTIVQDLRMIQLNADAYVTVKNGTVTGANTVASSKTGSNKTGGGFYCDSATLFIDNVTISNNTARNGGGIYANASTVEIKNSKFINNTGNTAGAAIYAAAARINSVYCQSSIKITDTVISENEFYATSSTDGGAIYLYGSTLEAENIKITNNGLNSNVPCAGLYLTTPNAAAPVSAKLKNSLISGNYAARKYSDLAAGISVNKGTVELENTVVRNNTGYSVGGITIKSGASGLKVTEGAIYNNTALNVYEFEQYSHDMYIVQGKNTTEIDVLAADKMVSDEEDKIFTGYFWNHYYGSDEATYEKLSDEIELDTTTSYVYHVYNASALKERIVAKIGDAEFTTIQSAIDAASSGDTIKLVVGESDNLGSIINEAVTIDEVKEITIDLNGKKWNSGNSSTKALTLKEGANVTITGEGTLKDIEHNGTELELNSAAIISKITLGSGKNIKASSNFELTKEISIEISSEDEEKLKTEDITLIETSKEFSEDEISKIKLVDAAPLVIIKLDENNNIIAHTMKGVFLNGETGDDSNDGTSVDAPVKTFAKAKEILSNTGLENIFVTGTVTVDGTEEWSLPEGTNVLRYAEFIDEIANVTGTLTVKDITIDGQAEKVTATEALIKVAEGGTLNIEDNAILTNNSNTKSTGTYYVSGGAVYSNGTVNMTGGEISENEALYGAGIELWGEKASMTLDGGCIKDNSTKDVSGTSGAGAGIAVMNGATLTMNNGTISKNISKNSRGIGGGILVGNTIFNDSIIGSSFKMNGGTISENDSMLGGGGIYVQCLSTATIDAGEITNNNTGTDALLVGFEGAYGGAGIYVNGGRAGYEDGKLYLANAYISENTAIQKEGAAIAGCGTSTVYVYADSATIYNNDGNSEIYIDKTISTGYGTTAKASISKIAAGDGENNWTNLDGEELDVETLTNLQEETKLQLLNNSAEGLDTEGKLATVKITGNTSKTRGGGIGTNGFVQIGEDKELKTEVKVTKNWEDNNDEFGLRPDSITVHLLANGEEVEQKEITKNDNWEYTFTDLAKYDENEEKIEYTITEDEVEEYETEIDGYSITNKCKKQADSANMLEGEREEEEKEGESSAINTSDNITMSFIALAISIIVISKVAKSRRYTPKHRK